MTESWRVQVFYDGECPLCMREIRLLRRLDRRRGRIRFTDIAAPDFSAAAWGTDHATLMGHIHGRLPDGRWVRGVEVFRQLYAAVGLGWVVAVTRAPGLRHLLDAAYEVFARNRLRLTGRRCEGDRCLIDGTSTPLVEPTSTLQQVPLEPADAQLGARVV